VSINLQRGAVELGIPIEESQASALLKLLDELDVWNERMNLTAIRERSQQITKHLLDSLSIHPFLRGDRIADIGTGAGFPGLPLALVNPHKQFTLIDSVAKKLRFVDHAMRRGSTPSWRAQSDSCPCWSRRQGTCWRAAENYWP
jgi:16S rRNA (guanine527-N7)-methyltransferase